MAGATLLLACLGGCGSAPIEAVSIVPRNLMTGLIAHWTFDDTLADVTGNGHDAQFVSGVGTWAPGRFRDGLRLQTTESLTIPGFPQLTNDWTVSVWIKMSQADRMAFTAERAVLLSAEKAGAGGWEIEFDPRAGFHWLEASYFVSVPATDYVVLDCKCIDSDGWMHFAAVFDMTAAQKNFSLYHDGVLTDRAAIPAPVLPGSTDLGIGQWDKGPRPISGVIDDYAIWSRALTADEIGAIYAQPVPEMP
jgi:Concanavalin A-like lectin/glucanases superfamily